MSVKCELNGNYELWFLKFQSLHEKNIRPLKIEMNTNKRDDNNVLLPRNKITFKRLVGECWQHERNSVATCDNKFIRATYIYLLKHEEIPCNTSSCCQLQRGN